MFRFQGGPLVDASDPNDRVLTGIVSWGIAVTNII